MNNKWFLWMIQAAAIGITMTALFQELEKPAEERAWRGTIAGFIPYDFRLPTIDRLRDAFWNPYERRILTPQVFGIGWALGPTIGGPLTQSLGDEAPYLVFCISYIGVNLGC